MSSGTHVPLAPRIALAALVFAMPALAVDVIELKSGKLYQVENAEVKGDRLYMKLLTGKDQKIGFTVPLEKVVPEFVYYTWADQIQTGDVDQHLALAQWARKNGLFGPAWDQYQIAAKLDPAVHSKLPKIEKAMFAEQATWIYESAEAQFKKDDIKGARKRLDLLFTKFAKSKEVGRAKALLTILAEREQFLTEEKKKKKIALRARKQSRRMDKYLDLVERADNLVLVTRVGYDNYNARRRLHWAAYAYRKAFFVFDDLLLDVEVDSLRKRLKAVQEAMEGRLVRTFLKLADLHWVVGDAGAALGAVHEVMAIDPANKAANSLRERILDEPTVPVRERIPGYPYRRTMIGRAHLGRGRYGYRRIYAPRWGFGARYWGRHHYFGIRVH